MCAGLIIHPLIHINKFIEGQTNGPRNFKNWKDYLSTKYKIGKKDNHGDPFRIREIHWMNFGWGADSDGQVVHHPEEVWFRNSFSTDEP